MSVGVTTADADGSNRVPLESLGSTGALKFSLNADKGAISCTLTVDLPVDANPAALGPKKYLEIWDGPILLDRYQLQSPARGTPWQLSGVGLGQTFANYAALSSGSLTTNPNDALDSAIALGLPVTRPDTFSTPTVNPADGYLSSLMDAVAQAEGQHWYVESGGAVRMKELPTTTTYILNAAATPGGTTLAGYYSDMFVQYQTQTTSGSTTTSTNHLVAASNNPTSDTGRPDGYKAYILDASSTSLDSTSAGVLANGALALSAGAPSFTGGLAITPGQLLTTGGRPVRLAQVRPGAGVKLVGVAPDPKNAQLVFSTTLSINIGQWDYDADSDTATLTPYGAQVAGFSALLANIGNNSPGGTAAAAFVPYFDGRATLKQGGGSAQVNNWALKHL